LNRLLRRLETAPAAAVAAVLVTPLLTSPTALADPPETITLTAVVRDFIERDEPGGHADFERNKEEEADGLMVGVVAPTLSADGKPEWQSAGTHVTRFDKYTYDQWKDSAGRNICYLLYEPALGDTMGSLDADKDKLGFTNNGNFDKWYRDIPGINMSTVISLTLERQVDGTYVFDDKEDPFYQTVGGFFPIDNQLFGNSVGNSDHNFHFTTEINARFRFDASAGQVFRFVGDDDVWVFINGQLVIDLSGTHNALEQFVDLSRLGLADGDEYTLDIFHAERQTKSSNFAFQTNIVLEDANVPSVSASFD
jgi:fibro-slime domain-containing protein